MHSTGTANIRKDAIGWGSKGRKADAKARKSSTRRKAIAEARSNG